LSSWFHRTCSEIFDEENVSNQIVLDITRLF
jgi:hypothetical protein